MIAISLFAIQFPVNSSFSPARVDFFTGHNIIFMTPFLNDTLLLQTEQTLFLLISFPRVEFFSDI